MHSLTFIERESDELSCQFVVIGPIAAGMSGYHDAYRKLIPDMTYDITKEFRGGYFLQKVADNGTR